MPIKEKQASLQVIYEELHELLSEYAPQFVRKEDSIKGKRDLHLQAPKPVLVPGKYGGSPKMVGMADRPNSASAQKPISAGSHCRR